MCRFEKRLQSKKPFTQGFEFFFSIGPNWRSMPYPLMPYCGRARIDMMVGMLLRNGCFRFVGVLALCFAASAHAVALPKQCWATTGAPGDINYSQSIIDCSSFGQGVPVPSWLVAVQAEHTLGVSCAGVSNRSYPILSIPAPHSPVSLRWHPQGDDWAVNMILDRYSQHEHDGCDGGNTWVWYAFMAHLGRGIQLPPGNVLQTSHQIWFAPETLTPDAGWRVFVAGEFLINGTTYAIEVNLAWNEGYDYQPPAPAILLQQAIPDRNLVFFILDGPAHGLFITPRASASLELVVPWNRILRQLTARQLIPNAPASTLSTQVGAEVKNAALVDLWHANFRAWAQCP